MKEATQGRDAQWQRCGCLRMCVRARVLGEIKDMTWGNDAKFHLFVFFFLAGPSKFKNRAHLMEKGADGGGGGGTKSERSAESGGVLCGRRMQFEIGQIAFFSFFSTHEA